MDRVGRVVVMGALGSLVLLPLVACAPTRAAAPATPEATPSSLALSAAEMAATLTAIDRQRASVPTPLPALTDPRRLLNEPEKYGEEHVTIVGRVAAVNPPVYRVYARLPDGRTYATPINVSLARPDPNVLQQDCYIFEGTGGGDARIPIMRATARPAPGLC
jgi:hypothetical protein